MPKYAHDTERWLRSNAELYRRKGNQQMARNFELCAEDVKALRDELAELKDAVKALRNLERGIPEMGMLEAHKMITDIARAEVDRLLENES